MNLAQGPVKRPILTTMVYLIVIVVGVVSFFRLSIDLMPEISFPTISVSTSYENVGPEEMEELVTRPIEEAIAAVQGVEEITSTSTEGNSSVRVSFTWGYDLEAAANDIRDRIDRVLGRLPEDIDRPMIRKFDLSQFPVAILGVASDLNPLDLRQIIDDQVKYRLERVNGVAAVDIWGGLSREIHVNLDADKVKALGLSTSGILSALRNENRNIPAGTYKTGNFEILVRTQGEYHNLDEIRSTVVAVRNGAPIHISDFATVEDSWQEITRLVRVDGEPSVRLSINKQSGANTVDVVDAVKEEMERINQDIPQIRMVPIRDTSVYIRNSINNVGRSTLVGGILAVLILFLFLRNVSSTAIIATAIPVSIIATFGLIYFGGFTLNLMTFGGLALGIGMLVDSSIVVLENIYRLRESGKSAVEAALLGTSEVGSAIIASTTTTLVVFLPVVFMRGLSGIYFQQLAYVVAFSLLCSLIVALTLVPMLSSRFLHYRSDKHSGSGKLFGRIYEASERSFRAVEGRYALLLRWALGHKRWIGAGTVALFVLSIFLIRFMGVDFMPASDEGEVRVDVEMAVGTRLEVMDRLTRDVERIISEQVPELESLLVSVGGGGWRAAGGHTADMRLTLVPLAKRIRSSEEVANALRPVLSKLPGATIRVRPGQGFWLLRMMSGGGGESVTLEVRGYNLETSRELAMKVDEAVKQVEGITDTRISREEGRPEQVIRIDRAKAADLGLSIARIGEALQTAIGGTYASNFREGGKEYRILVRLSEEDRQNLRNLLDLTVTNDRGQQIVLRNVVQTAQMEGPVRIERKDQERTVFVYANFTGRDMGSVVTDVREKLRGIPVPKDFAIIIGGDYEEQQEAFSELMLGLILAIVLVYMVMAGQFESFRHPLVVLFAVPMAVIGVVLTMILTDTSFSLNAYIGCIMLGGIIVNNAILLVDYTNLLRRRDGMPLYEAIELAGQRRLRPILMTTLTTILGLLPLSFGLGEGGETQAPLARVVIGGLTSSTLITLVLVPVVYALFERKGERKKVEAGPIS
ncbi:efflux RND transporter permease subunit [bacterium]|nr:efflux RND transporter permease subunit [bacterium]